MANVRTSHNAPHVERGRLTDPMQGPTASDRRRVNHAADGKFAPNNAAAEGRGAKVVIERPEQSLETALSGEAAAPEMAQLVRDVRVLYRAAKRELSSHSPIVLAALATFARETVIAGFLTAKAAAAGIATPQGLALVEAAQKAEQRSERAALQAVTLAARLGTKRPKPIDATPWLEPVGGNDEP
jgi:hypothetical protein